MNANNRYDSHNSCIELSAQLEKLFTDEFWCNLRNEQISNFDVPESKYLHIPFELCKIKLSEAQSEDEKAWLLAVLIIHFANLGYTIKKGSPYFFEYLSFAEDTAAELHMIFNELIDILSENLSIQGMVDGITVYGPGIHIFDAINDFLENDRSFLDNIVNSDHGFEMGDSWDDLCCGILTDNEKFLPKKDPNSPKILFCDDDFETGLGEFI